MLNGIVLFSRFPSDQDRGGGCKREAQIREMLKPLDFSILSYEDSRWCQHPLERFKSYRLKIYKKINPKKKYWDRFYLDYVFRLKSTSKEWIELLNKSPQVKLAIVDDPIFFYPLMNHLYRKKIPIIALCQNIESLSFSQINSKFQLHIFKKEIDLLKKCRLVITISREESFLLNNFNIPNVYLPYYPTPHLKRRMLRVREKRKTSKKSGYLALGNVWNKVTLQGMKKLIKFWIDSPAPSAGHPLLVAGYGTTQLIKGVKGEKVKLLGEISNLQLDDTLAGIKAMICYQEFGSGALTKIQDMLIAGVPVIANPHASRSYHPVEGLLQFKDLHHLPELLKKRTPFQTDTPPIPQKSNHKDLIEKIRQILPEKDESRRRGSNSQP